MSIWRARCATRSRSPAPSRCAGSRRWSTRITSNRGDAIIASLAVTPQLRARVDFTDPYYRAPARFVSRRDAVMPEVRPEYLEGKKVGVIAGTSHEAYLKAMFTDAEITSYRQ